MAIWQFKISLVPGQSLVEKYGEPLPTQLNVNKEGWEAYMKETDFSDRPAFEDAFTVYWWLPLRLDLNTLQPILEEIGDLQEWTADADGLRNFGNPDTNDISVCFDSETNNVEDVSCRIDLRNLDTVFIGQVLSLAKNYDCLLMDRQARLFEVSEVALIEAIRKSNAMRFVKDPNQFFSDLSGGIISPE